MAEPQRCVTGAAYVLGEMPGNEVLCVDIGGTSTKAGLVDETGQVSLVRSIATGADVGGFVDALCSLIDTTARSSGTEGELCGVGVAVAGFLDPERARLIYNPNLPWLERFPLKDHLMRQFGLPIELETDSNSACMAEYRFGINAQAKRFLCITVGTGLGVGMTIGGEPLRFAYGCMGDAGHIIVDPEGPPCSCGGRGCAEAIVAAPSLVERYRARTGDKGYSSLSDVIGAARRGNDSAVAVLHYAGKALGIVIASLANTFFPDHIAIAGGLSAAERFVMEPAEQTFREAASTLASSNVRFSRACLGPHATLIGAAWPFWNRQRATGPL